MTKTLYMMLADGLDMQLTGTAQCMTPSLSRRNNLLNFGLVSPCFKRSSKTCKEIRTKISPLYQNHKAYKMVYCSQKIASLSHCRVQKLYFKHTSYIPSFLIPTPTFHHIGVGVLRIRTRHLETHCYLLPLNAFITYDILIYIYHIHQIYIHTTGSTHTVAMQHSFLSPQKVSFGESTSIHPLCSDRNLSTISAFQSFVSSGKPSDSIVSDPVDKGKDLYTFKRLVSCWKERTIHWSSSSNSIPSKPCVSNVARCTKLGT